MGPLSAKQHREYLKFDAQEKRESAKMEREESRKQELHEVKLMEAAAKATQSVGHKEQLHQYKMGTTKVSPLGKSKVKTPNPLAGTEMFGQGQHMLPFQAADAAKARKNTDTVPAMLTPGEAIIPEPAAQDPRNKPIIKKMVQQGRKANRAKNFLGFADGTLNVPQYYENGTEEVPYYRKINALPALPLDRNGNEQFRTIEEFSNELAAKNNEPMPYPLDLYMDRMIPVSQSNSPANSQIAKEGAKIAALEAAIPANSAPESLKPGSADASFDIKERPYQNVGEAPVLPMYTTPPDNSFSHMTDQDKINAIRNRPKPDTVVVPNVTGNNVTTKIEPVYAYQPMTIPPPKVESVSSADASYDINGRPYQNVGVVPELPMFTDNVNNPKGTQTTEPVVVSDNRFPTPPQVVAKSTGGNDSTIDAIDVPKSAEPVIPKEEINNVQLQAIIDEQNGLEPKKYKSPDENPSNPAYYIKQLKSASPDVTTILAETPDKVEAEKSLKDYFTYKGIKDLLGLNDLEVTRLAVSTLAGYAMGYDPARSLSFAGKQAFETSSRRMAQEAQDKRQDKQLKASESRQDKQLKAAGDREDTRTAIAMASAYRQEEKADRLAELQAKRLDQTDRKMEAKAIADDYYRNLQELKLDMQWNKEQKQFSYKVDQDVTDAFNKALAADVPNSVRVKALSLVGKTNTYESKLEAMRNATIELSANTRHKEAKDPNAYKPNWQPYVLPNGNPITASRRPDGRLDVVTPEGTAIAPSNYAVNNNEKKDNENTVRNIVKNRAEGIKGLNAGQVGKMQEDAVLMSQQFERLNPVQFAAALEKTFSNLSEKGEGLTSDSFKHAFTTAAIVEMNPTYAALYSGTDEEGKSGYLSDKAQIDMGKAMETLAKSKGGLDAADKQLQAQWSAMSQDNRNTMWRIGSNGKDQDVGVRRKGYSAYSEFVIEMAKPPEQRKYPWLKTIK